MFQSYLNGVKRGFYWGVVNLYGWWFTKYEFQGIQELQDVSMGYRLVRVKKIGIICVIRAGKAILTYIKIGRYPIEIKMDLENCISGIKE